jgi:hypothetical protein
MDQMQAVPADLEPLARKFSLAPHFDHNEEVVRTAAQRNRSAFH